MKRFFLAAFFLPTFAFAQYNHYVGAGTYVNYSMLTAQDNPLDTVSFASGGDFTARVNASPFVSYTFAANRLNASIGVGLWHNSSRSEVTANAGFFSFTLETEQRHKYLFIPVSIGYDIVHGEHLKAGAALDVTFRSLMETHIEVSNSFIGTYSQNYSGEDLDTLDATRFFVSPGASLYAGYEIGRFMPVLKVGALYDLTGISENDSDKYKYLNLYAAVALRFRLNGTRE